jgi:hypothetical protein
MPSFIKFGAQLTQEFRAASVAGRLSIIADLVSIIGLSLTAVIGTALLRLIRPISLPGAFVVIAGLALSFALMLVIHGLISVYGLALLGESRAGRVVYYLIVITLWSVFLSLLTGLLPDAFQGLVLEQSSAPHGS